MSSQSVMVTPSEDLAHAVHSLASKYGTSHLWRAYPVENGGEQ